MTRVAWFAVAVVLCAVLCHAEAPAGDKRSKKRREPTGTLTVDLPTKVDGPKFVLVSLYRDGELVRSRELEQFTPSLGIGGALGGTTSGSPNWKVRWEGLPCGTYDVCFEARGYAKGVKRVRVASEDGDDLVIHVELGAEPYRLGQGLEPPEGAGREK